MARPLPVNRAFTGEGPRPRRELHCPDDNPPTAALSPIGDSGGRSALLTGPQDARRRPLGPLWSVGGTTQVHTHESNVDGRPVRPLPFLGERQASDADAPPPEPIDRPGWSHVEGAYGRWYQRRGGLGGAWRFRREARPRPHPESKADDKRLAQIARDAQYLGPPLTRLERAHRHGDWQQQRECVDDALVAAGMPQRVVDRFRTCGGNAWVYGHKGTGALRVFSNSCKNRWCRPCAIARANLIAANVKAKAAGQRLRMVTLTWASERAPLSMQITGLLDAFRKMRNDFKVPAPGDNRKRPRRVVWWRHYVRGGVAFLEVTRNVDSGLWHVHLHALCAGRYIPTRADDNALGGLRLSDVWRRCTGGRSYVVDVRAVDDVDAAAAEVSKYASKPLDGAILSDVDAAAELIRGMAGRRLCYTFGGWRGYGLTAPLSPFDPTQWVRLGPLDGLIVEAQAGNETAQRWLNALRAAHPANGPPRGARGVVEKGLAIAGARRPPVVLLPC
ncbi:MAG TPA: hypothetical protein VEK85_17135 [Gemmatimonadales bacterium]|nr:hypothetical protein [Gemmatimonadales bacterium]